MSGNNISSWAASLLRGGRGLSVGRSASAQPIEPVQLYEYEACPFCKKVRDVLSELDLEYVARTSAHGSEHRKEFAAEGQTQRYPYLVDPNTNTNLYESEDIITYLHATYGKGRKTWAKFLSPLNTASALLASSVRQRGRSVASQGRSKQPDETLVLYNFEASPYCRKVREALCELDLDCHVKNVAKKSSRRSELKERGGKMMVPYLIDANTNTELYESDDIVAYLHQTYG